MSLNAKKWLAFIVFAVFSALVSFVSFVVPVAILGIILDPSGQASGFLTGMLLVYTPMISLPAGVIAGLIAFAVVNRSLKAATLLRSDYAAFLIAIILSAVIGIVLTYMAALIVVSFWVAVMKFLGMA